MSTTFGGECLFSLIIENLDDSLHSFYITNMIFLSYLQSRHLTADAVAEVAYIVNREK